MPDHNFFDQDSKAENSHLRLITDDILPEGHLKAPLIAKAMPLNSSAYAEAKGYKLPLTESQKLHNAIRALRAHVGAAADRIQVEVRDAVLILRGFVAEARQRRLAADSMDDIDGIFLIRNEIKVCPTEIQRKSA